MRIAVVAYTNYLTDPRVRREAEALADRGDAVEIFCLCHPERPRREIVRGVTITRLPLLRYRGNGQLSYIFSYIWFTILVAWHLSVRCIGRKYDLIHVHNMPDFVVFSALFPKLTGTKVILDIHDLMLETYMSRFEGKGEGWRGRIYRWLLIGEERLCTTFADYIITVHEPYKQLLINRGLSAHKISVIMNVPDDYIFSNKHKQNQRVMSKDKRFLLIHHGTIVHRHGVDIALRAVARLRGRIPGLKFNIIGEGDFLPEIKELIQHLDIQDIVDITDSFVPVDELPPLLVEADLAVVPNRLTSSTQYILPLKLMEYIQLEIPTVVSRTPMVERYFDNTMVRFFEPEDAEGLARAIMELYESPEQRAALTQNARRFTLAHNWRNEKQILYAVVNRLTKDS